jgi:hypothetical protein
MLSIRFYPAMAVNNTGCIDPILIIVQRQFIGGGFFSRHALLPCICSETALPAGLGSVRAR